MSDLLSDLQNEFKKLSNNMEIPKEIEQLYQWIDENGLVESHDGLIETPKGMMGDPTVYSYGRISSDYEINPDITFTTSGQKGIHYWFDLTEITEEISSRLVSFAESGFDGSQLAFWLDDSNSLRIVHMGSGSGSMLCCVVANNAREFLSLLAIGYGQLGDVYDFSLSPEQIDDEVKINHSFVDWLKLSFGIKRPHDASAIIKTKSGIGDKDTNDAFCLWCNKQFKR
ncbi:hypothetical protein MUA01_03635 [Enterobacteriaceae bacterium H18W14]|uniref:hypothetical protein n=1 Tax=Dryocola boscaweniae TaxID=2925397 RepID=UPI0022F0FDF4|nr:hypothetical protein [Dryocola boscaweniae]MCT4714080.1 hypothetical protein [Dryocola boscaweniae]